MEIKTAFEINNLVVHKFDNNQGDQKVVLEVIEINSVTCYAGTQVFYHCRPIHIITMRHVDVTRVVNGKANDSRSEYSKYREDEIISAPKELSDIVLQNWWANKK